MRWYYTTVYHRNITLGTQHNAPLAYAPGLEYQHPIVITLGYPGGWLEREREYISFPLFMDFFFKSIFL